MYGYGYGAYDTGFRPEQVDVNQLLKLKFTRQEINSLKYVLSCCGTVTPMKAQQCGADPNFAKKLKYMFDISTGRITIETPDDLSKHLRKMFGAHQRIGIQNLAVSKLNKVPRKCLIGNIPAGKFELYNSKHYDPVSRMYDVVNVTSSNIEIVTSRKPVLKYREKPVLDGVIEITQVNNDGTVNAVVNKQYARLCNRFIVVASLRRPEWYHGLVEIICIEGTKIYVFATTMKDGETPSYKNGTQRVYDFGFYKQEIKSKLLNTAQIIYNSLGGVYSSTEAGNMEFEPFKRVVVEETYEDDVM